MTDRDYLLAFLDAEGSIPSRTMLQKLVYLAAAERDEAASFRPYFYGPFSAALQSEIELLVAEGLVEERAERLEPWEASAFEPMRYRYTLTLHGKDAAARVGENLRERSAEIVTAAREARALNPAALSMAAKLHHLRSVNAELGEADVPALASRFGWRMSTADATRGARLLERLNRR